MILYLQHPVLVLTLVFPFGRSEKCEARSLTSEGALLRPPESVTVARRRQFSPEE